MGFESVAVRTADLRDSKPSSFFQSASESSGSRKAPRGQAGAGTGWAAERVGLGEMSRARRHSTRVDAVRWMAACSLLASPALAGMAEVHRLRAAPPPESGARPAEWRPITRSPTRCEKMDSHGSAHELPWQASSSTSWLFCVTCHANTMEIWQLPAIDALISIPLPQGRESSRLLSKFKFIDEDDRTQSTAECVDSDWSTASDCSIETLHEVGGADVEVDRPDDKRAIFEHNSCKLFVGGLPSEVRQLKQFFDCHGQVVDHVVMMARSTKRSRGFGFVTFAREEDATKLLREIPGETGFINILDKRLRFTLRHQKGRPKPTSFSTQMTDGDATRESSDLLHIVLGGEVIIEEESDSSWLDKQTDDWESRNNRRPSCRARLRPAPPRICTEAEAKGARVRAGWNLLPQPDPYLLNDRLVPGLTGRQGGTGGNGKCTFVLTRRVLVCLCVTVFLIASAVPCLVKPKKSVLLGDQLLNTNAWDDRPGGIF
ncbi:hypothetical protein THAOC_10658 [Thalassiosira oceanica]|uniref:RRM domain-containing protein n=1 Tax=Thalassiosira oceanica TaxID=159749 RepID=K0STC3_THAOC|nr:hypothetical protein THAOC_10658 [Thalassiosira oceanica]|eukprot:EJK68189.1 hypothetical protein THAOC_10658 [Thalassiosira oceanica]